MPDLIGGPELPQHIRQYFADGEVRIAVLTVYEKVGQEIHTLLKNTNDCWEPFEGALIFAPNALVHELYRRAALARIAV